MTNYNLEIWHDHDVESPNEYSLGKVISFNSRHSDSRHPDVYSVAECLTCDGYGIVNDDDCPTCEGTGERELNNLMDHPDVLAVLSYYEHGLCRWMVGDSTVPDYGGFDTVNVAGVIVWNNDRDEDEREWWDSQPNHHKAKTLELIAEEYTDWANGECYGYSLEQRSVIHDCPNCGGHVPEDGLNDSCGGFIGIDALRDHLRDVVKYEGIDPDDVTISGEYGYVIDNDHLAPLEATV